MIGGKVRSSKRRSPAKRSTKRSPKRKNNQKRKSTKRSPAKRSTKRSPKRKNNQKRKSTKRSPAKRNTKRKYKNKQRGGYFKTNYERYMEGLQEQIIQLSKQIMNIDYDGNYLLGLSEDLLRVNNDITVPSKQTKQTKPSSSWWNIFSSNNSQQQEEEETNNDNITLFRELTCNVRNEAKRYMKEYQIFSRKLSIMINETPCDTWTYEHSKNILELLYTLYKQETQRMRNEAVEKYDSLVKEFNLNTANFTAEKTYNSAMNIWDIVWKNFRYPIFRTIFHEGQYLETPKSYDSLKYYVENPISDPDKIEELITIAEEVKEWRNKIYLLLKDIQNNKVNVSPNREPIHNSPSRYIPPTYDYILNLFYHLF